MRCVRVKAFFLQFIDFDWISSERTHNNKIFSFSTDIWARKQLTYRRNEASSDDIAILRGQGENKRKRKRKIILSSSHIYTHRETHARTHVGTEREIRWIRKNIFEKISQMNNEHIKTHIHIQFRLIIISVPYSQHKYKRHMCGCINVKNRVCVFQNTRRRIYCLMIVVAVRLTNIRRS